MLPSMEGVNAGPRMKVRINSRAVENLFLVQNFRVLHAQQVNAEYETNWIQLQSRFALAIK